MRYAIALSITFLLGWITQYLSGVPWLAATTSFSFYAAIILATNWLIASRHSEYKAFCIKWLQENGYLYENLEPERRLFLKGKLKWRASDAQRVFVSNNGESEEFWFLCGSWWLGTWSQKVNIYRAKNDRLIHIDSRSA